LKYHFVWCPKYRRVVLRGNVGRHVAKVVKEVAERYDFSVVRLAVMPDDVHLFVSAPPEIAPAEILRVVKSITAREVFKRFPGVKRMLWGGNLWERGYFVMSSGTGTTNEMIQRYIKQQGSPQADDQPNLFG
jgi:putative transposase